MRALAAAACLLASSLARAEPETRTLDHGEYEALLEESARLVGGLREKVRREDVVMIRRVEGDRPDLVKKAVAEALLAAGVRTANTKEEIEALRAHYRSQGIDIYKNREFQRLLTASSNAKLSIDAEHRCSTLDARRLACVLWLRAYLPSTLAYAGHGSYVKAAPRVLPSPGGSPPPTGEHGLFFWLLAAYAFVPPLLHRLDIQLRQPDGRWRSPAHLPIHALGSRVTTLLATLSFMVAGPTCFERWVFVLEHHPDAELWNFLTTLATMGVLAFAGSVTLSLWPLGRGDHRHRVVFRELFILHPDFWTKRIEGHLPR